MKTSSPSVEEKRSSSGSIVLDTVREYTEKYPSCVLLVQVGDFYELYESHAKRFATQLDLKLTRKEVVSGIIVDFAGFPLRSLDRYLDILVNRLGCRVALCEQHGVATRDDGSIIGIHRKVTRVITPGTVIEENFLDSQEYNYLLSIYPVNESNQSDDETIGLAWVDLSIGELIVQQTDVLSFKDDIARIQPKEILLPLWMQSKYNRDEYHDENHPIISPLLLSSATVSFYPPILQIESLETKIEKFHQDPLQLKLQVDSWSYAERSACAALIQYVESTHLTRLPRLHQLMRFNSKDILRIDSAAITSLELVKGLRDGKRSDSLTGVIDHTVTSAGSRMLTTWLTSPLTNPSDIDKRLDIVQCFQRNPHVLQEIRHLLGQCTDVQRILQRLVLGRGQLSDLFTICHTLHIAKSIRCLLSSLSAVDELGHSLDPHEELYNQVHRAFDQEKVDGLDGRMQEYGYIRRGFDNTLTKLYDRLHDLEIQKSELQERMRSICGSSVSLLESNPFPHVVEVRGSQAQKLVHQFHGVLTSRTKSKQRFQIDEWTQLSVQMENTRSAILEREREIFEDTLQAVFVHSTSLTQCSALLAKLDVLSSFATLACHHNYVRPKISIHNETAITGGRHPVVEWHLARNGRPFIRNNCSLKRNQRIWLLTGPNMGGKSTFLRQNALIVILAHMGCFVPAQRATIGITDKIFSRVGAADNLAQDQSTFMVEMMETASILKQATARSLVIMDEVGRGTSTTDGIALAYAVLDHLHNHIRCKTLFATHYNELADAVSSFKHVKCYKTDLVEDAQGGMIFVHNVRPGVCRQSHGLKVAQLAGFPDSVLQVAGHKWKELNEQQGYRDQLTTSVT